MIQLDNITKDYGSQRAVDGLSLDIARGTVFAFLGPNGAGKTTTIKMMVGLLRPTSGRLTLAGYDAVAQAREAKSQVGFVPDQPELYDKLTGQEFLEFIARMYALEPDDARQQIERLAETFQLTKFYDRLAEGYSHGMKQRVAFAAALIHRPQILILDEPMVGLDPKTMRTVKNLLREESQAGMTIFMSTHSLHVAEEVADLIGVINLGRLLFLGSLTEMRQTMQSDGGNLEDLFLQLTGD
ncbi:MAG: ABC transporter ATP-binding protein [Planctomycetales bacterium]|nr:ABC transporter ATP-binding protein [Planctomycetales bacterium]